MRVVLDLKTKIEPASVLLPPVAEKHRLVIDLYPSASNDPLLALFLFNDYNQGKLDDKPAKKPENRNTPTPRIKNKDSKADKHDKADKADKSEKDRKTDKTPRATAARIAPMTAPASHPAKILAQWPADHHCAGPRPRRRRPWRRRAVWRQKVVVLQIAKNSSAASNRNPICGYS